MFPLPTDPATTAATPAHTDFANVFLETHEPVFGVVLIILAILGGVTAMIQLDRSDESSAGFLFILGALTALGSFGLLLGLQHSNTQIRTHIVENMVANVQSKYGAKLEIDASKKQDDPKNETTQNLDKPKQYTLIFPNGASAGYKMYFTDKSEPMIVDDEGTPTAKELNQNR